MKRIIWGEVMPEVTRKCQLQCIHCCRGDAQELNMTKETVDAFLNQTSAIRVLKFSGGEPTLNVEIMEYWISEMKRRDIPLGGIAVYTNGVELSECAKQFYYDAYEYISFCRTSKDIFRKTSTLAMVRPILVQVSKDSYHQCNPEGTFSSYEKMLAPWDNCLVCYAATLPKAVGRGKEIASVNVGFNAYHTIPIVDAENPVICCTEMETSSLLDYGEAYVPCGIIIDTNGKIFPIEDEIREYVQSDNNMPGIAELKNGEYPSLLEAISEYNKDKLPCYKLLPNINKLDLPGILAMSQYQIDQKGNKRQNMELKPDDKRKRSILENKYKQERLNFLLQKVHSYREDIENAKKDLFGLNELFWDHLGQMLSSTNAESSIVYWLNSAIDKVDYRIETDDLLDLLSLLNISESFVGYCDTKV